MIEYSFGGHEFDGTGVYKTTPKTAPGVAFRYISINLNIIREIN